MYLYLPEPVHWPTFAQINLPSLQEGTEVWDSLAKFWNMTRYCICTNFKELRRLHSSQFVCLEICSNLCTKFTGFCRLVKGPASCQAPYGAYTNPQYRVVPTIWIRRMCQWFCLLLAIPEKPCTGALATEKPKTPKPQYHQLKEKVVVWGSYLCKLWLCCSLGCVASLLQSPVHGS